MSPRTVPIASIAIGERDRADMGDITALADSIKVVGLLHPVVVTEALTLVAGGRRLEATRRLGWTEVPVTVVDLTTVADALRAECDENVQRKPLNAIEASRARERRMRVLAEDAKRRQREHGHTAPGRPRTENTSTNFVEVSPPPATSRPVATRVPNAAGPASKPEPPRHQRERRSAAIVDSNFSSTTLDKVDKIRAVAERGVVSIGRGKERREEPVPAPVREVAKRALEGVEKTGAAVDRATREVDTALRQYVEDDPGVQAATYRSEVTKAISAVRASLLTLEPARVAEVMTDLGRIDTLRTDLNAWFTRLDAEQGSATVLAFARSN